MWVAIKGRQPAFDGDRDTRRCATAYQGTHRPAASHVRSHPRLGYGPWRRCLLCSLRRRANDGGLAVDADATVAFVSMGLVGMRAVASSLRHRRPAITYRVC